MSNIVYVLTNPIMPGIVKIGMTDRPDVQSRMSELYTTAVPLPFECPIAWEIEDKEAVEIERALHLAFGPNRINSSREFFEMEPEQVEVLLRVMPGRDVTPQAVDQSISLDPNDRDASSKFKRRQSQTNETEFLESLNENGTIVYERVIALGKQQGMRLKWGRKGFSLNTVSKGALVVVCYGYPPSAYNQNIWTDFDSVLKKSNIPPKVVEALRTEALKTGLFEARGTKNDLMCQTDRSWDEPLLAELTGWLGTVVEHIREYETVTPSMAGTEK